MIRLRWFSVLFVILLSHGVQAEWSGTNIFWATWVGFESLYLIPTLYFTIHSKQVKDSKQRQRDEAKSLSATATTAAKQAQAELAETEIKIQGALCTRQGLNKFKQYSQTICDAHLAGLTEAENQTAVLQNLFNLSFGQQFDGAQTAIERLPKEVNCRSDIVGQRCHFSHHRKFCNNIPGILCDRAYDTRKLVTSLDQNGTWILGDGIRETISCPRFGAFFQIVPIQVLLNSRKGIWENLYHETVQNWTSGVQFDHQIGDMDLSQVLTLDKASEADLLSPQVASFLIPLCEASLQNAERYTHEHYNNLTDELNQTEAVQTERALRLGLNAAVAKASLKEAQHRYDKAADFLSLQYKIHLPILFLGGFLVGGIASTVFGLVHKPNHNPM